MGDGGAERSLELLAEALQEEWRLVVIAHQPRHVATLRRVLRFPSRVIAIPHAQMGRVRAVCALAAIAAAYLRYRPAAVVANTYDSAFYLSFVAKWLPGLQQRSSIYIRDFQWDRLESLLSRLPSAQILIPTLAVLDRPNYLGALVAERSRIAVVPDMVKLPPAAAASVGSGVLHLATINPFKGHRHLIAAAGLLRRRGEKITIESYGIRDVWELTAEIERLLRAENLSADFRLSPAVDDPSPLLARCRCVVVTSVSHSGGPETFGRTVIEAWAHRKPVVGFAAGGVKYLVESERDGLLVPEGDEEALADALLRLHRDDALCRRLGDAGFAKVQAHYELHRVSELFSATIKRHGAA